MRFAGRVFRVDKYWAVEVPILGIVTQGRSKKDALEMISDAMESLVDKQGFKVDVFAGRGEQFEVGASDQAALTALLLRRERLKAGLSLAQIASRLNSRSLNAYARYEQGKSTPTVKKLTQLFSVVAANGDFVLGESQTRPTVRICNSHDRVQARE